jgi:hypothetical protein
MHHHDDVHSLLLAKLVAAPTNLSLLSVCVLYVRSRSHATLRRAMVGEDVGTLVLPTLSQRQSRQVGPVHAATFCDAAFSLAELVHS